MPTLFYRDRPVAEVAPSPAGPTLTYEEAWRASPDAFPVSLSMPLDQTVWPPEVVLPWLMNLLPEGEPMRAMQRALGVAQEDVLGLVSATGGDLAGALRVGGPREEHGGHRPVANLEDLEQIIGELPRKPFLAGDEGVTMSLAGTQDKLPVALLDGQIAVPLEGAPSTHILKPDNPRLPGSVQNEALCMVLASRCRRPRPAPGSPRGSGACPAQRDKKAADEILVEPLEPHKPDHGGGWISIRRSHDREHQGQRGRPLHEDACQRLAIGRKAALEPATDARNAYTHGA